MSAGRNDDIPAGRIPKPTPPQQPNPPRSYATASASKNLVPKNPDLMNAVASTTFFDTPAAPKPRLTTSVWAPPRPAAPSPPDVPPRPSQRIKVRPVRERLDTDEEGQAGQDDTMGLGGDDDEDDVTVVEPVRSQALVRRKTGGTSQFRPAGTPFGSDNKAKGKEAALPDYSELEDWATGTADTQFTSSPYDHLPPPSSHNYATSSDRSTYYDRPLDYSSFDTVSRHFARPPSPVSVDRFGIPSEDQVSAPVRWISAKVASLSHGGLWPNALYDYKIADTPELGYLAMGAWSDGFGNVVESVAGQDGMAVDDDIITSSQEEEDARVGYQTITREELDSIRPHPSAFYSRATSSWVIVVALPDQATRLSEPYVDVELWHRLDSPVLRPATEMGNPPAPASPGDLREEYIPWLQAVPPPRFSRLDSTKGRRVALSLEGSYPTVLPDSLMQRIAKSLNVGKEGPSKLYQAIMFIFRIIDNVLFKGKSQGLPLNGNAFTKRLPWSDNAIEALIAILGFTLDTSESDATLLRPPNVDARSTDGKINRTRMLRCWLELGLYLEDYAKRLPDATKPPSPTITRIQIENARPAIIELLGGDSYARIPASTDSSFGWSKGTTEDISQLYHDLGVLPELTDEALISVYHAQVTLNPASGPVFLNCISRIASVRDSEALRFLLATERSQRHYTTDDLDAAYAALGLDVSSTREIDEELIMAAFTGRMLDVTDPTRKRVLHDACELIATSRGSDTLRAVLASMVEEEKPKMDVAKAHRVLDVPEDVEEDMLLMLYDIRVEDSPAQLETMKEALKTIAEDRNFFGVLRYARTGKRPDEGQDEWEVPAAPPSDRPLGLTNIANTCYLNSLLQYFFTIRELRETILQFTNGAEMPTLNGDELNRVGGRLITAKEVERSKRFVILLQSLFNSLIHSSDVAVTPETELAYLALVPSKEEEAKAPIETIVIDDDDDEDLLVTKLPTPVSPSVLGKRGSEHLDTNGMHLEAMAIDSDLILDADSMVVDSRRRSPSALLAGDDRPVIKQRTSDSPSSSMPELVDPEELTTRAAEDGVVEIGVPSGIEMATMAAGSSTPFPVPPPLPPRGPRNRKTSDLGTEVSNYMTFGRQNDVTECMDNVMFQIECALNPSAAASDASTSILQKMFYGKMRQRLELSDPTAPEPVRVQEEPFFSLLVDVAEEGRTVYDGLDNVFDDSLVTVSSTEARRTVALIGVPPILQIQLQRVQYDRIEKKIFKSNAYMQFGETISMDRYLEVDPNDVEAVARRDRTNELKKQMEKARARLAELTRSKTHVEPAKAFRTMFEHLANQVDLVETLSSELAEDTIAEAKDCEEEINSLKATIAASRASIEEVWSTHQDVVYQLSAVFIHRGTASSGHYFIYQRDSKRPDRWLKYNDSIVTDIDPKEEIFRETTGDQNPYFLVYCRTNRLDAIETICRTP